MTSSKDDWELPPLPEGAAYTESPEQVANSSTDKGGALRAIAVLHGPYVTSMVGHLDEDGGFQDVDVDSFDEIVSRSVVCMTCQGYPQHPCATYTMAAEALA